MAARHQRFIALDVDHGLGTDGRVGLREPIGAARMIGARHHGLKARSLQAILQLGIIHRKVERKFRRFAANTLRRPENDGLAPDRMQQLAREPGGREPCRHDDRRGL